MRVRRRVAGLASHAHTDTRLTLGALDGTVGVDSLNSKAVH